MSYFEDNKESGGLFESYCKRMYARKGITLVSTDNKTDREYGIDCYDKDNPENTYDFKNSYGSFIVGRCSNGTININNPWRLTTQAKFIIQGYFNFKLGLDAYKNPIKKVNTYTVLDYKLQYIKDTESITELQGKLNKLLYKRPEIEIIKGDFFDFFKDIIKPYIREDVDIIETRKDAIMLIEKSVLERINNS